MQRHVVGPLVTKQYSFAAIGPAAAAGQKLAVNSREGDKIHENQHA